MLLTSDTHVNNMPPESKSQVSVKLPTSLYDSLVEAVSQGKYQNQTAGIAIALEHDLNNTLVNDLQDTIQLQALSIEEKEKAIQKLVSDLSTSQAILEGHHSMCKEKESRVIDLQKQVSVKDSQIEKLNEAIEKQAVHIQSLIQENSKLNMKLLPEKIEVKRPWWKFW
jgi:Arc/MetJ-type ribon-helix-helix transcriptional regulator